MFNSLPERSSGKSCNFGDTMNKHLKIGMVALALVSAPLVANTVLAQATGQPGPASRMMSYGKVFVQKLAQTLGVDQAKLEAAMKTAGNATIDEALNKQEITKAQADALKARVQAGGYGFFSPGGMDGRSGRDAGRNGGPIADRMAGRAALMDATAKALGLSSEALFMQLRSGKSITEIAAAQKVDVKTVQAAMLAAYKTQLEAAVKAGKLTQAQADERLKAAQANPNFGLMGGRGGRGGPRR
jgi:hypothetical protein